MARVKGLKPFVAVPDSDRAWQQWLGESGDLRFISGTGDPNGTFMGNRGQMFLRDDTGDVYKKTTDNANTGWVAL